MDMVNFIIFTVPERFHCYADMSLSLDAEDGTTNPAG